jgi:hypothetical protein
LPFLRWVHRFSRPLGTQYSIHWEDRVRNYLIGFRELGWDTKAVAAHFKEHLGEPLWSLVVARLGQDMVYPKRVGVTESGQSRGDASAAIASDVEPEVRNAALDPAG